MSKIKVCVLSRYPQQGASSRLRMLQYIPWLEGAEIAVEVQSFFGTNYLSNLYAGRSTPAKELFLFYWQRLKQLLLRRSYDLFWIEKEVFPYLPAIADIALLKKSAKVVIDYDDAVFLNYRSLSFPFSLLLKKKIEKLMRLADLVVVGNDYLLQTAKAAGAKRVEYLPTVVDIQRYQHSVDKEDVDASDQIVVGWMGSPSTRKYLSIVDEALCMTNNANICLHVIGANKEGLMYPHVRDFSWAEEAENAMIQQFDIGIMPLFDTLWEQGKCGYKLIQYMACAKPVIASPIGVNCKIVHHGKNGLLAPTVEEWVQAINTLTADSTLRKQMGAVGRKMVEEQYSLQVAAPRLVDLLLSLR